MDRDAALAQLLALQDACLVELAAQYGQTIFHEKEVDGVPKRTLNKGWAGLTLERVLGLPANSRREPNGGSWELKQVSLKKHPVTGIVTAKETMQITMFNAHHIIEHSWEESHVMHKIGRMILVARLYVDKNESTSPIVAVRPADISLEVPFVYERLRTDYEEMRARLRRGEAPRSVHGTLIQSRTKGAGHGSTSRAWYARTRFVNLLLGIDK